MGNGQLSGLVDAALHIEFTGAMAEANGSSTAGFTASFLRAGIEVEAGAAALLVAASAQTVEVDPFTTALG